ncbi:MULTISPECIES: LuxR C-terminal-related transcriptional regulator [Streptomyces]|uniref:LuxR C-terminal-related transcriptional regulator n=1 Tax=Streptomyces TaxID=1883 RepID=UPI0029B2C140|nr:LuxR C-terminal-related transcriptional regulator [Streptomyces sp. ID01-15D]MDX3739859.1 LuxR C-terminal-related transcriptional regulator [Streptomyces sp. ID01-15D]
MIATCGSARRSLARAFAAPDAGPVLLFVEGAAGLGKTHLLRELADLPDTPDVARLWWRCGAEGGRPDEGEVWREPTLLLVDDVHRADEDELRRLRRVLEGMGPGSAAAVTYRPEELPVPGMPLGGSAMTYPFRLTVLGDRLVPWDEDRVRRAAAEVLGESCTAEAVGALCERTGGVPRAVVDLLAMLREQWPAFTGTAAEVAAAGVPARLAELVLSRTYAVSPEQRPVVWAAAVLDGPAARDELIAVSGLGAVPGDDALLRALERAALAELGEGRYGFAVPLAAAAVRDAVPGPVRQELHRRAAGVLSRRQPVPWAAVGAHHRAAGEGHRWLRAVEKAAASAAASGRHQQAITLLEQTLATPGIPPQARARLAPLLARNAVTGLRSDQTVEVLAQIVQDADLPPAVRGELRLDLGLMLCNQMGRFAEGWRVLEVAAAELGEVRSALAARAMAALVTPYWPGASLDVHRGWLIKAAAAADDRGDDAMRTAVLANHVGLAMSCADPEAWDLVERLPVQSTDPACARQAARGLCNAADSAVWLGFYERGAELLADGRDLSARSGAPYTEHSASGTRLLQEWWTGQWLGLAKRCEDFVADTADMPFLASDAYVVRGLLAVAQGDWAEARAWLSQRGTFGTEDLPVPLGATAAGAVIRLTLARQEVADAAEQARAAWTVVAEKGVWPWAAELTPWAVEALARAGDTATAHAMVRDFARGLGEADAPAARAALVWSRAVLAENEALAEGRPEGLLAAAEAYRKAAAAYAELPRPYSQALTTECAGRCVLAADAVGGAAEAGGGEASAGCVSDAESGAGGTGASATAGAGKVRTGLAASAGPKSPPSPAATACDPAATASAIAELESCAQHFTDLGAVWDATRVRALLRTRQPAKKGRPPGRPSHSDQLSPREAEVAQLASSGLTNREIAATLHLSPRTVEQHIAGAMRKTGALSRRDLAHRL